MSSIFSESKWFNNQPDILSSINIDIMKDVFNETHYLLEGLGDRTFTMPDILIDKQRFFFISAGFFESIDNTLKSILVCCKMGNFTDANVLLRKYRDNLFQWLFIISLNEELKDHTLDIDNCKVEFKGDSLKLLKSLLQLWFRNDKIERAHKRKYFDIQPYIEFIIKNEPSKTCYERFLKFIMVNLDTELNDYTHGNGKMFIQFNNSNYNRSNQNSILVSEISERLEKVTACFLSLLIMTKSSFLMSSDYSDYHEVNLEPPENCQYWISPIFQLYIDKYLLKLHPDLKEYLSKNNPQCMIID